VRVARATLPEDLVLLPSPLSREKQIAQQAALMQQVEEDERELARLYARRMRLRSEVAKTWGHGRPGKAAMELAGTARIGQDRATREMVDGLRLTECFPRALALLEQGRMYVGTAQMLLGMTKDLSAELQSKVGDRVCDEIAPLDAADARQVIARTIVEVQDAEQARQTHERARAQRGVWVKPVEHGHGAHRRGGRPDRRPPVRPGPRRAGPGREGARRPYRPQPHHPAAAR